MKNLPHNAYSPLYFLSALGSGGLSVSFFMYLMFLIPHPQTPMPQWSDWMGVLQSGDFWGSFLVIFALLGVLLLGLDHFIKLAKNIFKLKRFSKTEEFHHLWNSHTGIQFMAFPLTLAMSVNVIFIFGSLFVPGIWNIIEYLFPFAIGAFAIIGVFTLNILFKFLSERLIAGNLDGAHNNNLSQMLGIFATSMVAVGLAGPAAMSHTLLFSHIAFILSLFFVAITLILASIQLMVGFRSIFRHGIDQNGSASLWIMIPTLTLVGITIYRLSMAAKHHFNVDVSPFFHLILTGSLVSLMIFFGILGYLIMKKLQFFKNYIHGENKNPLVWSLICPGVASVVFGNFFINYGLVQNHIVDKYSVAFWVLYGVLFIIQMKTLVTLKRIDSKLLKHSQDNYKVQTES